MANTYTQIYLHVVFAVQRRQNLIKLEHKDELQKYMAGIVSGQGQKLIAINNMPDHFHFAHRLETNDGVVRLGGRHQIRLVGIRQ